MNKYKAGYNNKRITVIADTLFSAKEKALSAFSPPKSRKGEVWVVLVELAGKPVELQNSNADLG